MFLLKMNWILDNTAGSGGAVGGPSDRPIWPCNNISRVPLSRAPNRPNGLEWRRLGPKQSRLPRFSWAGSWAENVGKRRKSAQLLLQRNLSSIYTREFLST